jgi:PAS domain S-box-containing protein
MSDLAQLRLDDARVSALFGDDTDPIEAVALRARELFPEANAIVWAGDPQTFQFSYVSAAAELVLGYASSRWSAEPTFWVDFVVHPDDRDDAVAYCALATAKRCHHRFEYRARATDGRIVWLHDLVRVVPGAKGIPVELRGVMFDVTSAKRSERSELPASPWPSRDALTRM